MLFVRIRSSYLCERSEGGGQNDVRFSKQKNLSSSQRHHLSISLSLVQIENKMHLTFIIWNQEHNQSVGYY